MERNVKVFVVHLGIIFSETFKLDSLSNMKVNDEVTYVLYTDADAGWVSKVSPNGKTIEVELGSKTLLNGVNSGEPDALHFSPGGFMGHVSGVQRWKVEREENPITLKFTLRKTGQWKLAKSSTKSQGCELIAGHSPYYDFNF
jgi:hypothetical protein